MPVDHLWFHTVSRRRTHLPSWVTRTESPWLFGGEGAVRQVGCWRLLAPAPMLVTLAEQFNDHRFERAAEDAWHLGLVSPVEAAGFLDAGAAAVGEASPGSSAGSSAPRHVRVRATAAWSSTS